MRNSSFLFCKLTINYEKQQGVNKNANTEEKQNNSYTPGLWHKGCKNYIRCNLNNWVSVPKTTKLPDHFGLNVQCFINYMKSPKWSQSIAEMTNSHGIDVSTCKHSAYQMCELSSVQTEPQHDVAWEQRPYNRSYFT